MGAGTIGANSANNSKVSEEEKASDGRIRAEQRQTISSSGKIRVGVHRASESRLWRSLDIRVPQEVIDIRVRGQQVDEIAASEDDMATRQG